MTQLGGSPVVTKRGGGASDVYTILVVVAFIALCVGIGTILMRSSKLFPGTGPFDVPTKTAGR